MLGFDEPTRRNIRTMLCVSGLLLAPLALLALWLSILAGAFPDAPACKRSEMTVPNGRNLVANVRRTA
jgi:hypothetical protein